MLKKLIFCIRQIKLVLQKYVNFKARDNLGKWK